MRAITHQRASGRQRRMPDGGRHVRDGGPAQLVRRLLQDLCAAAGAALALSAEVGRAHSPEGELADQGQTRQRGCRRARRSRDRIRIELGEAGPKLPDDRRGHLPRGRGSQRSPHVDDAERARRRSDCCSTSIPTAGHGIDALRSYAALADAYYPARRRSNAWCRAGAISTRNSPRWPRRCAMPGWSLTAITVSPVGRPAVDAARQQMAGMPAARRCLCGGAPCLSRACALGGGMLSYFTELNRKRVPAGQLDFITPLHLPDRACGRRSQRHAVAGGAALHHAVGPRDLSATSPTASAPRPSPCARTPMAARPRTIPAGKRIAMANRDPRHAGLFAAAWTWAMPRVSHLPGWSC